MGLLDFFFGKEQTLPNRKIEDKKIELLNEYDRIKKETEILQSENNKWEKEFKNTTSSREKALQLEKEGKIEEALGVYLQSIELDEKSNKLTIYNYAFDIDRVIILYGKTKQKEKLKIFLEDKINKHKDYNRVNEWLARLSKLNSNEKFK